MQVWDGNANASKNPTRYNPPVLRLGALKAAVQQAVYPSVKIILLYNSDIRRFSNHGAARLQDEKKETMENKPIYLTEFDLERLQKLLWEAQSTDYRKSAYLEKLQAEIRRARVVSPREVPGDVITMNSTVCLKDTDTGEEETYTLVFPEDADLAQGKLSVLAPVGTAMLGYKVGDIFEWDVPAGKRHLQVEKIIYQPESSGNFEI